MVPLGRSSADQPDTTYGGGAKWRLESIRTEGFTPEKYSSAIKQLEAAGAGKPKGRTYHCALESDGAIQVFDIWESQADFDALGPT